MRRLGIIWILLSAILLPAMAANPLTDEVAAGQAVLKKIGQGLAHPGVDSRSLADYLGKTNAISKQARSCIESETPQLVQIRQQLAALGQPVKGESWQVTTMHLKLERQQNTALQIQANCRLLQVNAKSLHRQVLHRQRRELTAHLLRRSESLPALIMRVIPLFANPARLFNLPTFRSRLGITGWPALAWLGGLGVLGWMLGRIGRRRLHCLQSVDPKMDFIGALVQSIMLSLDRYRLGLLIMGLWSIYWLATESRSSHGPLLAVLSFIGFVYFGVLVGIRASFDPPPPAQGYLPFSAEITRRFSRALRGLALTTLIGAVFFLTPLAQATHPPLVSLVQSVWSAVLVVYLIWVVWQIRHLRGKQGIGIIRLSIAMILVASLITDWAGYRNLGQFLLVGVVLSVATLLFIWLVLSIIKDFFAGLETGRYQWEAKLKHRLGLQGNDTIPGLLPLNILLQTLIWLGLLFVLLIIWGLPVNAQQGILRAVSFGFSIGHINIEPGRWLFAILLFSLFLSFRAWANILLEHRLHNIRMDRGAREAALTIADYSLVILATIITLSVAGVSFQNLAIIAGALSVGIGFGLQNIVNNFVSGLILLFERPIRSGDWISVNNIQGYVRKISIRSTQIQTFDRADVIVPNSDLISQPVTNMMFHDHFGRMLIPVGVAYGSDTQKVKEILLSLANDHLMVVKGRSLVPDPSVLFLSFGDSSLNFELRVHVRDVSQRLSVLSDLNFAIDTTFREAGIEIPFPQRDIHIIQPRPPARNDPSASSTY